MGLFFFPLCGFVQSTWNTLIYQVIFMLVYNISLQLLSSTTSLASAMNTLVGRVLSCLKLEGSLLSEYTESL